MTVTLAKKKYTLKDFSLLRWRINASKAVDAFTTAFVKFLEAQQESLEGKEVDLDALETKAEETFHAFANAVLEPKWFGLKKFNKSLLDVPVPEVNALRAAFFSQVTATETKS